MEKIFYDFRFNTTQPSQMFFLRFLCGYICVYNLFPVNHVLNYDSRIYNILFYGLKFVIGSEEGITYPSYKEVPMKPRYEN